MSAMSVLKRFIFDAEKPPILYREGTSDEAIIKAIMIDRKEYAFPAIKPSLVFDIGGNIGVVAVLMANLYPDAIIHSFEPVLRNYQLLVKNAEHYPNIKTHNYGLGNRTEKATIHKSTDPNNLGGYSTFIKDGEADETIQICRMSFICSDLGTPDLVKIDVEGAEYDILSDVPDLSKIMWITGELHGIKDYLLLSILQPYFHLNHARNLGDVVWHFNALNKSLT